MTYIAIAHVLVTSVGRYLQQLGNHWGHITSVTLAVLHGVISFAREPRAAEWGADAPVMLDAERNTPVCAISVPAAGRIGGRTSTLRHDVGLFAFREMPLTVHWMDR